jgi:hypothetical protein
MDRQKTLQLKLNNLDIDQLKSLIREFTKKENKLIEGLSKNDLLQILSTEAQQNKKLQIRVNSLKVSFKPSFYLLAFHSAIEEGYLDKGFKINLKKSIEKVNSKINTYGGNPVYKNFEYIDSIVIENKTVEFDLVWQKLHWFWSPFSFTLDKIYELNYGIIIIDIESKKAVISCHTVEEQEIIKEIILDVFKIKLNTLTMTKPLLDKVGSYDKVKRARYFISKDTSKIPENITYADDNLSLKVVAKELEDSPSSERKESFYRIPLGIILEQGVGVTSDSGKLWIPKNLPVDTVKDYAKELLIKITSTLDNLTKDGNIKTVYDSLGIQKIEEIQSIKPIELRSEVYRIIYELLLMVLNKDSERPFTIDKALVNENSVPSLFNYPRLEIYDELTDSNCFYIDKENGSQLIKIKTGKAKNTVLSVPKGELLNLESLEHQISGNKIKVSDLYSHLELLPTPKLQIIINIAFKYMGSQFDKLVGKCHIPFRIKNNKLILDYQSVANDIKAYMNTEIFCGDIIQLKQVVNKSISPNLEDYYKKTVNALGEMCDFCEDTNCRACIRLKKYICLRSLVGEFLLNPTILSHKAIELSDIQGRLEFKDTEIILYGFAKQVTFKDNTISARNPTGAVLLAQVLGQIEKSEFDTVLIITPNIVNEDLANRLRLLCSVFKKKLLIFDHEILKLLLNEFEIRAEFKSLIMPEIYKRSNKKLLKLN